MPEDRKRRHSPTRSPSRRHREKDYDKRRSNDDDNRKNGESSEKRHRSHDKHSRDDKKTKEAITKDLQAKEVIYQAQMLIDDRKQKLNMPKTKSIINADSYKQASTLKPEEASVFVDFQMDKLNKLAELKSRLSKNSALSSLNNLTTPAMVLENLSEKAVKQEAGFLTPMTSKAQTSGISSTISTTSTKPKIYKKESDILEFLDPRLSLKSAQRPRRSTFEFKAKGEFEKLANIQRSKAKLEKLQSEISRAAKHTGISSAVKLAIVTPSGSETSDAYIPTIEWWDEIVLGKGKRYRFN